MRPSCCKGARVFELEEIGRLLEQKVHQTLLEIDLNAVAHNLKQYQQLLRPETKLMGMVKAFSYGSGSFEVANVLQFHKIDYLAVAYADEGVELRRGGINLPVMVMNVDPSTFDVLVQYNLEPDIYAPELLHAFEAYLRREGIQQFPVHIELETGMNRLGFSESQLPVVLDALQKQALQSAKRVQSPRSQRGSSTGCLYEKTNGSLREHGEQIAADTSVSFHQAYRQYRWYQPSSGIAAGHGAPGHWPVWDR